MKKEVQKLDIEDTDTLEKLEWEAPKLYSLDKGKTESGPAATTEDYTGSLS